MAPTTSIVLRILLATACWLVLAAGKPPPPIFSSNVKTIPASFTGYEPDSLRARLAAVDSADVARACGTICSPWAYRGPLGRHRSMKSYGRHRADSSLARALAHHLLESTTIDSATKVPSTEIPCEPTAAKPVYIVAFHEGNRDTYALLRFDLGVALFFDAEEPLGMVMMGAGGDSLWAALGELMDDDPLLRQQRPQPPPDSLKGDWVYVEELPATIKKVKPYYPLVARQMNLSGQVMIQARVGADGAIQDAFVVSGHPVFRDDALEAIWQWQFKPARTHGQPIPVWVAVPVKFTLH